MTTITKTKYIEHSTLEITCTNEGAGLLDTKVEINGKPLCWITYSDLDNFINELEDVVSKYRI
jgi:hypothetical protein